MVESVTARTVTSIDEIPAVCLEDDLVAIFRLSASTMRWWRKYPEHIPFPPLPMLDRQIRVSGCVVAWFLAQESGEYHRAFLAPLEALAREQRGRTRPPWWMFAPPHAAHCRVTPLDAETPVLGVPEVAAILRTTPSALQRAARTPEFPMPPAHGRPLRWTEGQVERLLWAPQDHEEHRRTMRRKKPNPKPRFR